VCQAGVEVVGVVGAQPSHIETVDDIYGRSFHNTDSHRDLRARLYTFNTSNDAIVRETYAKDSFSPESALLCNNLTNQTPGLTFQHTVTRVFRREQIGAEAVRCSGGLNVTENCSES